MSNKSYILPSRVSITGGKPEDKERESVVTRLLPSVYQALEKKHAKLVVHQASTALEVAYQLGVQSVLADLRNGYVVES